MHTAHLPPETLDDTKDPPVPTGEARFGWRARGRLGTVAARNADTASRLLALNADRAVDAYRDGRHPRPAEPVEASWSLSKVLWAFAVGVVFAVVVAGMSVAAVAFQTGFLNAVLPDGFKQLKVFFLPWVIDLPKLAPVGLEFTSWSLALVTLVLVLRRLPYGRWHRAMWSLSLFVAVSNGAHIGTATRSVVLGVGYGAFSVIAPALIHYFVLFVELLRSGVPVRDALAGARDSMRFAVARAIGRAVGAVCRALLAIGSHPFITLRTVSIMGGTGLPYRQAHLLANRAYRLRLAAEARGEFRPVPVIGAVVRLVARVRATVAAARAGGQPAVHAGQHALPATGRPVELPPAPRPDTPLTGVGDAGAGGRVLTAVREPEPPEAMPDADRDRVLRDGCTRAELGVLTDPDLFGAALAALTAEHGVEAEARVRAVYAETLPAPQPAGGHAGVPTQRGDDQVDQEHAGGEAIGTQSWEQGLVIRWYWRCVHDEIDVHAVQKKQLAGQMFGEANRERKRSMVSRVWRACLSGDYPDPDPGYADRPRAERSTRELADEYAQHARGQHAEGPAARGQQTTEDRAA